MGHRYLNRPPQSAEAIAQLAQLPPGAADDLRVLGSGDYLILYAGERVTGPCTCCRSATTGS